MIENLSGEQKSVLLARAMGWTTVWNKYGFGAVLDKEKNVIWDTLLEGDEDILSQLYYHAHMYLAWQAHLWGIKHLLGYGQRNYEWWFDAHEIYLLENAQEVWLDKVLELAIEAGIVEVENESG